MARATPAQASVFAAARREIAFQTRHGGLSWDQAIQSLSDLIRCLEAQRDQGADPETFPPR